jgi:hypothetical protein
MSKRRGRYRKPPVVLDPAERDALVAGLQEIIDRNRRRRRAEQIAEKILAKIEAREKESAKNQTDPEVQPS